MEEKLNALEFLLVTDAESLSLITDIVELCTKLRKRDKSLIHIEKGMSVIKENQKYGAVELAFLKSCVQFWKSIRFLDMSTLRINMERYRFNTFDAAYHLISLICSNCDDDLMDEANILSSYMKECKGQLYESLDILSTMISEQRFEDLSYLIFRAASK